MTKRILPLACAVWMLAIFVAAPYAAQNAPSSKEVGPKPPTGHLDLGLFTHSENCVACHSGSAAKARLDGERGGHGLGALGKFLDLEHARGAVPDDGPGPADDLGE